MGAKKRADADGSAKALAERPATKKLSYKDQRELEALPARIEALEGEQRDLHARIASPAFYKEAASAIAAALARVEALQVELIAAYARWDDLESRS